MTIPTWNSAELLARTRAGAMRGVVRWIGLVEARAVELIQSPPKSGRIYRRRGVTHQASAPGQAPASDHGTLVAGRKIDLFDAYLRARLTFTAKHAKFLEFGTRRMEPRPFARRALRETFDAGQACVREEIEAALR